MINEGEAKAYLRRFGYLPNVGLMKVDMGTLSHGTDKNAPSPEPEEKDDSVVDAIRLFQKRAHLKVTGELDEETETVMRASRCAMPDDEIAATELIPWDRRHLKIAFGNLSGTDVPENDFKSAVLRACDTWMNAGAGLTITEVDAGDDIRVECRPSADPDFSMVGAVVAHADYPPGASIITGFPSPPLPCHFDATETTWSLDPDDTQHDIETIALHEIGHCLGLRHQWNRNAVMYGTVTKGRIVRELHADDLAMLRHLYP